MANKIVPKVIDLVESNDPEKITLKSVITRLVELTEDLKRVEIDQNLSASERAVKGLTLAQKDLFYLRNRVYTMKQNIVISRKQENNKIIINNFNKK